MKVWIARDVDGLSLFTSEPRVSTIMDYPLFVVGLECYPEERMSLPDNEYPEIKINECRQYSLENVIILNDDELTLMLGSNEKKVSELLKKRDRQRVCANCKFCFPINISMIVLTVKLWMLY